MPTAEVESGINDTMFVKALLQGYKDVGRQSVNCSAQHSRDGLGTTRLTRDFGVDQNTAVENILAGPTGMFLSCG